MSFFTEINEIPTYSKPPKTDFQKRNETPTYNKPPVRDDTPTPDPPSYNDTTGTDPPAGGSYTPPDMSEIEELRAERLAAAIASIQASFGADQAGQEALLATLAPQLATFRETSRLQEIDQHRAQNNYAIERGIYNSGINIAGHTGITSAHADAVGSAVGRMSTEVDDTGNYVGTEARAIQSAILQMQAQQGFQEQQARLGIQQEKLDLELFLASLSR